MTWIWIALPAIPLLLALLIPFGGGVRRLAVALTPFAALPALGVAVLRDPPELAVFDWLLLGTHLGLDQTGQVFLLLTALLWTIAGIYARAYHARDEERHRFAFFFSLTMAGNLGLILAGDLVTFYTAFALMTFAGYGLVVHSRGHAALRAGKVYIVMAVIGEGFLLAGLLMAGFSGGELHIEAIQQGISGSARQNWIIGFLLAGFGIKAGAIPLHIWLPLAHPVAPTAASAVLSGAMIKAGLLGWLRFIPIGEVDLAQWGTVLVVLSLTAAFAGVLVGLTQDDPKTLLAYSSISQMGFITTVVAVGFAAPDAWPIALAGCLVYVLHHGLIKGVLFLGVGVAHTVGEDAFRRRLVLIGLTIAGISLAGAPLTTGAVAKASLKEGVYLGPAGWSAWLDWLLPVAAIGTAILMGRFIWIIWRKEFEHKEAMDFRGLALPWAVLLVLAFPLVWAASSWYGLPVEAGIALEPGNLWTATWPVVVAIGILALLWQAVERTGIDRSPVEIPAGDLLVPLERVLNRSRPVEDADEFVPRFNDPVASLSASWYGLFAESTGEDRASRVAAWLIRWEIAGILFVSMLLIFFLLLIWR